MQKEFYYFLQLSIFGLNKINRSAVKIRHTSPSLVLESKVSLKCHKISPFLEVQL